VSQTIGKENFKKFQTWRDSLLALADTSDNWDVFKPYAYRGDLSKTRISQATNIDLNALKSNGNKAIYDVFKDLESMLQKKIPDVFTVKLSALEQYHAYVDQLEHEGGKLPVDAEGDIDIVRLAKCIGLPRTRLDTVSIKKCLADDILRVGTETVKGKTVEERMENHLTSTSTELSKCRKDLAIAEEQIDGLKKQNFKLERQIRQLQQQSQENKETLLHCVETGRRFSI
jgi:hypothetical protein